MKKKIPYVFISSLTLNDGEASLSLSFLKAVYHIDNFYLYTPNLVALVKSSKITSSRKRELKFNNIYLITFYHAFLANFFKNKSNDVFFLNYLPLWNFLIFLILDKKIIIGPITGNSVPRFSFSFFRNLLFPILNFLSSFIILLKWKNIYPSNFHVGKYFRIKNYFYPSIINIKFDISQKTVINNRVNIGFYYRSHPIKNCGYFINFLNRYSNLYDDVIFHIFGEFPGDLENNFNVIYHGYLNSVELNQLFSHFDGYITLSEENAGILTWLAFNYSLPSLTLEKTEASNLYGNQLCVSINNLNYNEIAIGIINLIDLIKNDDVKNVFICRKLTILKNSGFYRINY